MNTLPTSADLQATRLSTRQIVQTWWPLVASALLNAIELPVQFAILARLSRPEINLAAYSGIVYTLTITIAALVSFLLPTSIALGKDWDSYLKLRSFAIWLGGLLTAIHALIAFTPLYDFVVVRLIGVPGEIVGPARLGMMIMTPWTWIAAYRCLNQGILIRGGQARAVSSGTLVRLSVEGLALLGGYRVGNLPGILVVTVAAVAGAVGEAIYVGLRVRPLLRGQLKVAPPVEPPLTFRALLAFYVPLALTELISVPVHPLRSAALSRMPLPLESLAVYPVVHSLLAIFISASRAYHDVVVALLDRPQAVPRLRRFALGLAGVILLLLLTVAMTPLAGIVFGQVAALAPPLVRLAQRGLWIALLYPSLLVFHSFFQGALVHSRLTWGVPEGLVVYLLTSTVILGAGVIRGQIGGLYIVLISIQLGFLAETTWMWWRSRPALRAIRARNGE